MSASLQQFVCASKNIHLLFVFVMGFFSIKSTALEVRNCDIPNMPQLAFFMNTLARKKLKLIQNVPVKKRNFILLTWHMLVPHILIMYVLPSSR